MRNGMSEIVFLGKGEEYEKAWTWCISLPIGSDFYAAIEMTKKIAKIPEMLSVVFHINFNRFDFIGTFPGKRVEKDYDEWILETPQLWLSVYYKGVNDAAYSALHEILFVEYKNILPNIDAQSGI